MNIAFALFAVTFASRKQAPSIQLPFVESNWTPPQNTAIPPNYLQATKALLGNGLADPRGGQFRKVTVMLGNASWRNETSREKTGYGWVLPTHEVVLVDGVKYSVKSDLGTANPADLLSPEAKSIIGMSEDGIVIDGPTHAMSALLLVRGETELAEQTYQIVKTLSIDPVLSLYVELLGRYRMQVAQCLVDHKDVEAKQWATQLAMVSELRERAGVNYDRRIYGSDWALNNEEPKQMLSDIIRRIDHPKPKFDFKANAKLDQGIRIKNLVEALDEVTAYQWGQPGGLSWQGDPVIDALCGEGEAAIPALLDTIESDQRTTRSVSFGRDFSPARTIHTVRDAASVCLGYIWPSSESVRPDDPKLRILLLRDLWKKSKNLSEPERWLNVLKDDNPAPESYKKAQIWVSAAQHITARVPVWHPNKRGGFSSEPGKRMQGDTLKTVRRDEFTAILTKRIQQLTQVAEIPDTFQFFEIADAFTMGHCLAKWQGRASLPVLKKASENALIMQKELEIKQRGVNTSFVRPFALVIADRSNFGDASAAKDLVTVMPFFRSESFTTRDLLTPMWKCLKDSAIQALGKQYLYDLLQGNNSTRADHETFGLSHIWGTIFSPMILSPAYRSFLVEACATIKVVGTVTVTTQASASTISYKLGKDGGGGSMGVKAGIDLSGYLVTNQPLTSGDYLTQVLSQTKGCPPFLLSWPEAKKSAARVEIAKWLMDKKVDWLSIAKATSGWGED